MVELVTKIKNCGFRKGQKQHYHFGAAQKIINTMKIKI
jgi:hypothetical protein